MTWFGWTTLGYGLLLVAFLGVEIRRQRRGTLPVRQIYVQRVRGVVLLAWPLVLGGVAGDRMTGHQQFAAAVTPFVLLLLFAVHMAMRETWRDHFERKHDGR